MKNINSASGFRIVLTIIVLTSFSGIAKTADAPPPFVDAKPWPMTASNTKGGKITFNPDGTGTLDAGIMKMNISWSQNGPLTCIKMGLMGEHCLKFIPVVGGFEGKEQGSNRHMSLHRN